MEKKNFLNGMLDEFIVSEKHADVMLDDNSIFGMAMGSINQLKSVPTSMVRYEFDDVSIHVMVGDPSDTSMTFYFKELDDYDWTEYDLYREHMQWGFYPIIDGFIWDQSRIEDAYYVGLSATVVEEIYNHIYGLLHTAIYWWGISAHTWMAEIFSLADIKKDGIFGDNSFLKYEEVCPPIGITVFI